MSRVAFTNEDPSNHLWLLYYDLSPEARVVRGVRLPLIVLFALSALSFVPPGQAVGTTLQAYAERGKVLWGYAADLFGSLIGVAAFALMSFAEIFPLAWFSIIALGVLALVLGTHHRPALLVADAAAAGLFAVVIAAEDAANYSPHYAINVQPGVDGTLVSANVSRHQIPGEGEAHPTHRHQCVARPAQAPLHVLFGGTALLEAEREVGDHHGGERHQDAVEGGHAGGEQRHEDEALRDGAERGGDPMRSMPLKAVPPAW